MNRSSALKAPAGLQARMLLTIFLLGVVYVALMAALFAAGASGITIAVVAGGLFVFQLTAAEKLGLRAMGAEEVGAARGARAARDGRAALRPGRPAEAEDRDHAHLDAQRVRDGPLEEARDGRA